MTKTFIGILAAGMIASASSAMAGDGEYYEGVAKRPADVVDQTRTGSIHDRGGIKFKTSRDNRLPFDGEGNYYEGAQRPN
ncbi:hypothetical protein REJC140_02423 [Pseudorhizobium endolithicum]|uniref:Uncharacterized protein n=1 Tax=Pseudorhizobium endolithicum TaxID=1191678 RepID=A0ABN7JFD9_9HYPH|nr:hypothetical protein [Pseudorhizobium endolithicum]CAD7026829.1 hypothetical protein REJC140_02423 [Pseudorhizobium endolithicum]